jgi:hypothetical protein
MPGDIFNIQAVFLSGVQPVFCRAIKTDNEPALARRDSPAGFTVYKNELIKIPE